MLRDDYQSWINKHVPLYCKGLCDVLAQQMAKAFSELTVVKGIYDCPLWDERGHWWCVAPDGSIVDPTAAQFPSGGLGEYRELSETALPTGRCMHCGAFVYHSQYACPGKCLEALREMYTQ